MSRMYPDLNKHRPEWSPDLDRVHGGQTSRALSLPGHYKACKPSRKGQPLVCNQQVSSWKFKVHYLLVFLPFLSLHIFKLGMLCCTWWIWVCWTEWVLNYAVAKVVSFFFQTSCAFEVKEKWTSNYGKENLCMLTPALNSCALNQCSWGIFH